MAWPTPADLAVYLGEAITATADIAQAQAAIDAAKALIQEYTRQTIDQVLGDVTTLDGISRTGQSSYAGGGSANVGGAGAAGYSGYGFVQTLQLPQTPVNAISSVTVDGVALASTDFFWNPTGLLWRPYGFIWGYQPRAVVVTYDHGYTPTTLPNGFRTVALSVATRIFSNPQGLLKEAMGNYSAMYYSTKAAVGALEPEEEKVLDRYNLLVLA